jgi:hypothetical protein
MEEAGELKLKLIALVLAENDATRLMAILDFLDELEVSDEFEQKEMARRFDQSEEVQ